jgi:cell wall-associated NlpC family hydrolase
MPENTPVVPVILLVLGGYLSWFGVHYWRSDVTWPSDPIKDVLQGKSLPANTPSTPSAHALITSDAAALQPDSSASGLVTSTGTSATGSAISDDALKYQGAGYVFGGNASKVGDWDCSSFVSYVLGHDLGLNLPGGRWGDPGFPPATHGPTTLDYLMFGSPLNLDQVQAGDLIVSTEHMGIAISPTEMISAQDEALGTGVAGFPAGFPAGPPHYRRVSGTGGTGGILPTPTGSQKSPIGVG